MDASTVFNSCPCTLRCPERPDTHIWPACILTQQVQFFPTRPNPLWCPDTVLTNPRNQAVYAEHGVPCFNGKVKCHPEAEPVIGGTVSDNSDGSDDAAESGISPGPAPLAPDPSPIIPDP